MPNPPERRDLGFSRLQSLAPCRSQGLAGAQRHKPSLSDTVYKLNQSAIPRGTANEGFIRAFPKRVRQLFGEPVHWPGDTECLGNYIFTSDDAEVLTLYCMAYDAPEAMTDQARRDFWNYSGIVELHIGARSPDAARRFRSWIEQELAVGTAL
jgi:hypothetical protein